MTQEAFDLYRAAGVEIVGRVMWEQHRTSELQAFLARHPAMFAIYGFDEPDAKD